MPIDVVKRRKRPTEPFSRDKLHGSLVAACLSVRTPEGQAHDAAHAVCEYVILWGADRPEVTSTDIRHHAAQALETLHPEAAYYYRHYKHIM